MIPWLVLGGILVALVVLFLWPTSTDFPHVRQRERGMKVMKSWQRNPYEPKPKVRIIRDDRLP